MPEKRTLQRARKRKEEGKQPTTQAGEFVREEMEHLEQGEHRGMSRKQAVAVGLSKARRAGVDLKPPAQGAVKAKTRQSAQAAYRRGQQEGPLKGGSKRSSTSAASRGKTSSRRKKSSAGRGKSSSSPSRRTSRKSSSSSRSRSRRR